MSCDPTQLATDAKCIECAIPPGMYFPVLIALLCQIRDNAGLNNIVIYTSDPPANPPNTSAPAIAYDPNGILPMRGWNITNQTWT